MNLVLLGPPGSGKGTEAKRLAEKLGWVHLSTGELSRREISRQTPLGKLAKDYVDRGELVPDEVMMKMAANWLKQHPSQNRVVEGIPRSVEQAVLFDEILEKQDQQVDLVINLPVNLRLAQARIGGRLTCPNCEAIYNRNFNPPQTPGVCDRCGEELIARTDQAPDALEERFAVYEEQTRPLIKFYRRRGILKTVSGEGSIEAVYEGIIKVLGQPGLPASKAGK